MSVGLAVLTGAVLNSKRPTPAAVVSAPPSDIDFTRDVLPILQKSCYRCHGEAKQRSELRLDSREAILKGGDSGPAAIPGKSAESLLIRLVSNDEPDRFMPDEGDPLTREQIATLKAWIDGGLKWGASPVAAPAIRPKYELSLRHVGVPPDPPGAPYSNPIDRLLAGYFKEHGIERGSPIDDRTFARRVYLDVIGLLPPPEDLAAFIAEKNPDKRRALVRRLLADNRPYAEHWLTFWNDCLRNDYKGTGYIDGGRQQITQWLLDALYSNMPFDRFTRELVAPSAPGAEGFTKGITWRGVVNASQVPPMQAAQNVSQVFLGLNVKCASCHDSFINEWKLTDSYGLAAVFADQPLEISRCDNPIGEIAHAGFLYPELGSINPDVPRLERQQELARLLTARDNGRFTRTIVNRLWARFLGRGLIEPQDEMDNTPWNADLLDFLAADLADSGYNLKNTIELILTSRAYQMPSVDGGERTSQFYVFRGPSVRRMSAEQFVDAVRTLTGSWPLKPDAMIKVPDEPVRSAPVAGNWIWDDARAATHAPAGSVYFRRSFHLAAVPAHSFAIIACDNSFKFSVNGTELAASADYSRAFAVDLGPYLRTGENVFAVEGANAVAPGDNPAGLFVVARLWSVDGAKPTDIVTDEQWTTSPEPTEAWDRPSFSPDGWKPASVLGPPDMGPWKMAARLTAAMPDPKAPPVRAALTFADPLTSALGRPNREQVVTTRASEATTLQALELSNGAVLDGIVKAGAARWLADQSTSADDLARKIYLRALGRTPTKDELAIALQLTGSPPTVQGTEDLLWSVTMLPEFQLIH